MSIRKGQKAPGFKLFNTEKKEISLEDYKGKNLTILFFPLAFTSTCTAELCSVRDEITLFQGLNSEIIGISTDTPFTLKKFKEEQNLNFDLLSDFNKEVSTAYESIYETFILNLKGVSKRSAFVIDKEGIIQYAEVLEKASDIPNLNEIKKVLAELN